MKKIAGIVFTFLLLGFLGCLIAGFVQKVPAEVSLNAVKEFKFCVSIAYFLKILAGVLFAGFVVGCAVQFGHNCDGSINRFSSAMMGRYKVVIMVSVLITALLTISNETVGLVVNKKKIDIINRPKIIQDYISVGNSLYNQGYYARAARYADAALKLDDKSEQANDLKNRTDLQGNVNKPKVPLIDNKSAEPVEQKDDSLKIDEQKISQAYTYLKKAKESFAAEKWFDAHYYAELGIKLTTPKDPNQDELKEISYKAWDNIQEIHNNKKTQSQIDFEEKYRGYLALVEEDDLKAYYIFHNLSAKSLELSKDSDVVFYLDVAKKRVEQKYFFVDETLELSTFETANDIYFTIKNSDSTQDIVYFKGMTEVQSSGMNIQYLRNLTITSIDSKGNFRKSMNVPYAKVLPAHVSNFDDVTKKGLGIEDDMEYVPYLILKSVGRDNSEESYSPKYSYAKGIVPQDLEITLLPVSFDDFVMLEKSAANPQTLQLTALMKLVSKAQQYGYSSESFGQILLNRLLYPLFLLCLLVLLASFAWNNRIGQDQYFKFSWVLSFPFVVLIMLLFYQVMIFLFKLMNYVLLAFSGGILSVVIAFVLYVIVLLLVSVYFMSRTTSE